MEYLTDEDYALAQKNGISRDQANRRFYTDGWSKRRTLTQPVTKKWGKFAEIAQQNGMSVNTFYSRVRNGMPPEEAATIPINVSRNAFNAPTKVTPEVIKQAAENGISENTLKQRVYNYRWPVEKAMTTPVDVRMRKKAQ